MPVSAEPACGRLKPRPGFSILWRYYRLVFRAAYGSTLFDRQVALTRFVAKLQRICGFSFIRSLEASAGYVASASGFLAEPTNNSLQLAHTSVLQGR